ncbi:hypothetical protein I4U23_023257 [Adineta vaga]|nr:hypothetical protein I4U23_023257 [Adineta vaga]
MRSIVIFLLIGLFSTNLYAIPNVTVQFCQEHRLVAGQQWQYIPDDHTIRPLHSDLCLTNERNGSRSISITPCAVGLNFYQVWSLDPQSGEITDLIGKCLGVYKRNVFKASVELAPCTGKNNQHWMWKNVNGGLLQIKWPWIQCLTAIN